MMKSKGLRRLLLACAGVSLGAGCLGEDGSFGEGEDVETVTSPVTVWPASLESGIQYGKMWRWSHEGVNVVPLSNATTSACFLNSVWGSFASNSDFVEIGQVGPNWVLRGQGGDGSPSADAFCITDAQATPPAVLPAATVKDGYVMIPGATATAHTCFLTRIEGNWLTTSRDVRVEPKGTGWALSTKGVRAYARCVNRPPLPIESTWPGSGKITLYGDLSDPNMNTALNRSTTRNYFCSLTRITGVLNGFGNGWIGTFNEPVSRGWQWYVSGKKNSLAFITYPLSGAARCVQ
jgi:hypothetical protein